jgi:Acetyl xylan esterase (AXE1)
MHFLEDMRYISGLSTLFILAFVRVFAADTPSATVKTLDTPRAFPEIASQAQWQERSRAIREQILVSSGLWPMPEKTPLHAVISGKIERDGYSVEKVYFQSCPGFYVAGNLYRPLGKGAGPFPAILNPHGHWEHGRLQDTQICSVPGRCINFAKQGMIAFSYDMVGFNDTRFPEMPATMPFSERHLSFAKRGPANLLWSVTLMGLQTWDSIRALDFLESLPDVDKKRLACTGESGGGTQTFILGAIDDRLAAQAPVVMVSHTMQGGCQCENMPGLRVEYSNMEIAAAATPRPQILVSDTGDWTKTTPTVEGPAIEHIYQLFKAPESLRYVRFDCGHNYNQDSRQAVYQWFDKWLLDRGDQPVAELAFQKEPDQDLTVFPEGNLPVDAVSQNELIKYLIKLHQDELQRISPTNAPSLANYKRVIEPAWMRTLQLKWPYSTRTLVKGSVKKAGYTAEEIEVAGPGENETIELTHFAPMRSRSSRNPTMVVLAHEEGRAHFIDNAGNPAGLAFQFLDQGLDVVVAGDAGTAANPDQTSVLFTTYNRTRLQERVRFLVTVCEGIRERYFTRCRVVLCGTGHAGMWSLLAAPAADAVIADGGQLDISDDQTLLDPDLFCPGIRNIDTFAGAPILVAPHPLILFNLAKGFPTVSLSNSYKALGAEPNLKLMSRDLNDHDIVATICALGDLTAY